MRKIFLIFAICIYAVSCSSDKNTVEESSTTTSITAATEESSTTTSTTAATEESSTTTSTSTTTTLAETESACESWTTDSQVTAGWPSSSGEFSGPSIQETARIGAHEGYDRWVLEFRPGSTPPTGWEIFWSSSPIVSDGSGIEAEVEGTNFLSIRMLSSSGWALPEEEWYAGPTELNGSDFGTSNIVQAVLVGDFEGYSTWGIGADHEAPFNLFTLSEPSRLVIDICH